MLSQREHWQTLCEKPEWISRYVEELLRLDTPAHTFFRTSTTETTIGSVTVPANALLLLVFGSVNRDKQVFQQPDTFLPERQEKHMVFGWGTHFCLGASLARLEGRIALEALTQRYPQLSLTDHPLTHTKNLMFRGFKEVLVKW